ncbi:MAG TPA: FmdB family zinc ribbon protein [Thermoleophilia bacterium]|nr:FmdB family zinc ribbon protein [Thermoleophilia bacterium]
MPIYEYQCDECGNSFEVMQRMSDDPLTECEKCGGSLRKVLHPVAIHFKGSGFYTTDYGKGSGKRPAAKESGADTSASDAGGGSSDGGDGSKTEKKAAGEGKSKETQKAT